MSDRDRPPAATALHLLGLPRFGPPAAPAPLVLRHAALLVLARIALAGPGGVARPLLAEAMWPDKAPGRAAHSLTQVLSELRRCATDHDRPLIVAAAGRLRLDDAVRLDVAGVRVDLGRAEEPAVLAAAEAVTHGLLEGVEPRSAELETWLAGERTALVNQAVAALWRVIDAAGDRRGSDTALHALDLLLRLDPLDEQAHLRAVRLTLDCGRGREALRRADAAVTRLQAEFGAPPSDALRAVRRQAQRAAMPAPGLGSPRVVVMPVRVPDGDPICTALGEVLAGDLADALARLGDGVVIAPSAARRIAVDDDTVGAARARLDADYLVEVDVAVLGEGPLLRVRVVNTATAGVVWSRHQGLDQEKGGEAFTDTALGLALLVGGRAGAIMRDRLAAASTGAGDADALVRYARAREAYDRLTVEGHLEALALVRGALNLDPTHAPSWLLLAWVAEGLDLRRIAVDAIDLAIVRRDAVLRAHALDPFDGRALVERGDLYFVEGEVEAAHRCYAQAALDLAPETQLIVAKYLAGALDRTDDARAALERARAAHFGDEPWLVSNALRMATIAGDDETAASLAPSAASSRSAASG